MTTVSALQFEKLADSMNTVVLVPSRRRSDDWADIADVVTAGDGIADAVEKLRSGHVGLVVLINKYDGIDLPDEACRVLVIDGLPEAYGGIDRRDAVLLGESDAMVGRQLQRIEQGMGRGVRSAEDYCAVLLLGSRLTQLIADPDNFTRLGPTTRAQLELSREVARQLEGAELDDIVRAVRQSLDRDPGWLAASRNALAGVTYGTANVDPIALHLRKAFNAAAIRQYGDASVEVSAAINSTEDPASEGVASGAAGVLRTSDQPRRRPASAGWSAEAQSAGDSSHRRSELHEAPDCCGSGLRCG